MNDRVAGQGVDHASVVAPPPLIYLGALLVGAGLDYLWPAPFVPAGVQYPVGLGAAALGLLGVALSFRLFRRAGTHVEPYKPTEALIMTGPYRFSRNPIYVSMSLLYVGIAVLLDSLWVVALLIPTLVVMRYGVIAREERYLERKFGDDYRRYKAQVRRWL